MGKKNNYESHLNSSDQGFGTEWGKVVFNGYVVPKYPNSIPRNEEALFEMHPVVIAEHFDRSEDTMLKLAILISKITQEDIDRVEI